MSDSTKQVLIPSAGVGSRLGSLTKNINKALIQINGKAVISHIIDLYPKEYEFIVCLVSGDKRCSLNKLKKILNKKDVAMANANEVKDHTGFTIGGVSPTGYLKKLNTIIDKSLSRINYVYGAASHPDCVFKITYSELIKLTSGKEAEIIE